MPHGTVRFLAAGALLLVVAGLLPLLLPCLSAADGGESLIAQPPVDRLERGALAAPATLPGLVPAPLGGPPPGAFAGPRDRASADRPGPLVRGAAGSDPCRRE